MRLNAALSDPDPRDSERTPAVSAPRVLRSTAPLLAARILQFQATVLSHETFADAASAFASEIASLFHFDRAAIGFRERQSARVVAISHAADFQPNSDLFRKFSSAMDEALDQGSTITYPALKGARPLITLAHSELGKTFGRLVCTVPLVSRQHAFGALTLVRAAGAVPTAEDVAIFE